jgi:hypothetical protein
VEEVEEEMLWVVVVVEQEPTDLPQDLLLQQQHIQSR